MVTIMETEPLTFGVWLAETIARWRLVLKVMAGTVVAAALAVVILPPVFKSHASFVTASSSSAKMSSALGGGSGIAGLASQLGFSTGSEPSESPNFYLKLMESEELRRRLLSSRFQDPRGRSPRDSATLLQILRIRSDDSVRRMEIGMTRILKSMNVTADLKTNLVELSVTSRWPDLAAAIANRTIQLVDAFNHEQRVGLARSKRVFVQDRLDSARAELQQAEERQRMFYDQNRQWRSSPQLTFEEGRIRRGVDIATDLFLALQRQFETARLDEFNDAAMITVVDPAVPPHKAEWPRYWVALATSLAVGGILGLLVAGSAAILADWRRRNPQTASALHRSVATLPFPLGERRRRSRLP
jgi:uncharacterized protein involved in exopolysaccharide biosynthesis